MSGRLTHSIERSRPGSCSLPLRLRGLGLLGLRERGEGVRGDVIVDRAGSRRGPEGLLALNEALLVVHAPKCRLGVFLLQRRLGVLIDVLDRRPGPLGAVSRDMALFSTLEALALVRGQHWLGADSRAVFASAIAASHASFACALVSGPRGRKPRSSTSTLATALVVLPLYRRDFFVVLIPVVVVVVVLEVVDRRDLSPVVQHGVGRGPDVVLEGSEVLIVCGPP